MDRQEHPLLGRVQFKSVDGVTHLPIVFALLASILGTPVVPLAPPDEVRSHKSDPRGGGDDAQYSAQQLVAMRMHLLCGDLDPQ